MVEKIRAFVEKHWDMVSYLFFGVLTTAVNYLVYLPLYNLLGISAAVSNIIAWVAAVAFAYVTNKPFVFKSHDWSGNGADTPDRGHLGLERKYLEADYQHSGGHSELRFQQAAGFPQVIIFPIAEWQWGIF